MTNKKQNIRILLAAGLLSGFCAAILSGQTDESAAREYWKARNELEIQFHSELNTVIDERDDKELDSTAGDLQRLIIRRDPQRQYIFIPPENRVGDDGLPADLSDELKRKAEAVLANHADALFELAKRQATRDNAAIAYQLFNEVLFFAPNHKPVRKILGHRKIGVDVNQTWRVKSGRLRIKRSTKPHRELNWPAKSFLIGSTSHFQIVSRASEEETEILAKNLERWHDVWRQVFFEYHNRAKNLNRWIDGKSNPNNSRRKFKVVFFADKPDYVAGLENSIPGIEASTGFYNDQQKTSYFYASNDSTIQDTWRHELTHQLFQESGQSVNSPFKDEFLWLGEGIAMYFESLVDHGQFVTLGGFDSRRLQYARLRRLKEQFRIPIDKLSAFDRTQFQTNSEVAKVYSQSAGITHYLMNDDFGAMQPRLVEFLLLSYHGRLKPGSFEKLIGKSFGQIDNEYEEFLKISRDQLNHFIAPELRHELALIAAPLGNDSLAVLSKCRQLVWLDLSACDVRGERLRHLESCSNLRQLFLTGVRIDAKAAGIIAQLPVTEVDLSGSNLTNEQIVVLAGSKTLLSLNVTGTKVTSDGVKTLGSSRPDIKLVSNIDKGNLQ